MSETRSPRAVSAPLLTVPEAELREHVERLATPRHIHAQPRQNRRVAEQIATLLSSAGCDVEIVGPYRNVVAVPRGRAPGPLVLVGAHYDSVPTTPGADDNASGLAVLLACARALAGAALRPRVAFVAFNAEEDGLLGSTDFVAGLGRPGALPVASAHILEMVGFCDRRRGSQRVPRGVPIAAPDAGDFLGLLGKGAANSTVAALVRAAEARLPELHVLGLRTYLGLDRVLPVLHRSDHSPFWKAGIPAILWTDTAEFRSPHYHQPTDVPDTLDYPFMRRVAELLLLAIHSENDATGRSSRGEATTAWTLMSARRATRCAPRRA